MRVAEHSEGCERGPKAEAGGAFRIEPLEVGIRARLEEETEAVAYKMLDTSCSGAH